MVDYSTGKLHSKLDKAFINKRSEIVEGRNAKATLDFVKNNYDLGYANGTLGVVTGFNSYNEPLVRTVGGRTIAVSPMSWKIEESKL